MYIMAAKSLGLAPGISGPSWGRKLFTELDEQLDMEREGQRLVPLAAWQFWELCCLPGSFTYQVPMTPWSIVVSFRFEYIVNSVECFFLFFWCRHENGPQTCKTDCRPPIASVLKYEFTPQKHILYCRFSVLILMVGKTAHIVSIYIDLFWVYHYRY